MPRPPRVAAAPPRAPQPLDVSILVYDAPHYVASCTPPSPEPPITLVPPRDCSGAAFIVDKVVTPFEVDEGEFYNSDKEEWEYADEVGTDNETIRRRHTRQRVLNYVVAWPDEPFARQLVPCTKILDYVSPRVLEDWEYALSERQRQRRAAKAAGEAAALARKKQRIQHIKGDEVRSPAASQITATATTDTATLPVAPSLSSPRTAKTGPAPSLQPERHGPARRKRKRLFGKRLAKPLAKPPAGGAASAALAAAGAAGAAAIPSTPSKQKASDAARPSTPAPSLYIMLDPATTLWTPQRPLSSSLPLQQLPGSSEAQYIAQSIPSLASGSQRTGLSLTRPFQAFPQPPEDPSEDQEEMPMSSGQSGADEAGPGEEPGSYGEEEEEMDQDGSDQGQGQDQDGVGGEGVYRDEDEAWINAALAMVDSPELSTGSVNGDRHGWMNGWEV